MKQLRPEKESYFLLLASDMVQSRSAVEFSYVTLGRSPLSMYLSVFFYKVEVAGGGVRVVRASLH